MSGRDPIDFDSPLGISKREWVKVLGVNLALLLTVYTVALICTLCGSDLFLIRFHNDELQTIEDTLRNWNCFALIQIALSTLEMVIVGCYIAKAKPRWYLPVSFYATCVGLNFLFMNTLGHIPSFINNLLMGVFWIFGVFALNGFKPKEKWFVYLFRLLIALAFTGILNTGIALFRNGYVRMWQTNYPNSIRFALNVEYYLALALGLVFLTLAIPWKMKGGTKQWATGLNVSGSSPSSTSSSRKPSKIATNNLPPKYRKRLRLLKAKVIAIQTIGLIVIAALPWFTGRPVEFALVYASFCITRLMLGFNRSLHFKSEMVCVTSGALVFWALTFLTPNVETSIIISLVYGAGLALGFRLYWELHDLMMYHKAAKTDRYAMFYTVFKANLDPRHINGLMRAKGYDSKEDIRMVQMYMQKDKVEYIAECLGYAKITIEKRLTDIVNRVFGYE